MRYEHTTTMTPHQRSELVRILRMSWSFEQLSKLTDRQLHEQWLAQCQYIPTHLAPLGMPDWYYDDDDEIENLALQEFAQQEISPGYRVIDAVMDAIKELQV